ncbi:hypothetical protein SISSUDRAFT_1053030 [Sistotremastrum suecicum HHB10207 ss-3]|uniref:Uncharacterized protein n=1 Tax=Sistotremastrum suecicum HHB10207 ss-3 TaxID=1314776 RepID=A0A165ZHG0_9AGAM|nr:hypothetical protein SISSUDRAFT_1053030 [Sistotremastrum suecicum HHB10207 ss-3]
MAYFQIIAKWRTRCPTSRQRGIQHPLISSVPLSTILLPFALTQLSPMVSPS